MNSTPISSMLWVLGGGIIGSLGAVYVLFVQHRLPESPRWLASHGQLEQATTVVERMEAKALQQSGRSLPIPQPPRAVAVGERASFREIWQTPYRRRTVMLVIFHAAQAIGLYGFSNWMPTFLVPRGVGLITARAGAAPLMDTDLALA